MRSTALRRTLAVVCLLLPWAVGGQEAEDLAAQVTAVERRFAQSMSDRDFSTFESLLSDEAVFVAGTVTRRGKEAVAEHWKRYFTDPTAPFSWAPETVTVLDSGVLALSTGPVWNAEGVRTSTYTSVWRQEAPGVWRIVFDKGEKYCE